MRKSLITNVIAGLTVAVGWYINLMYNCNIVLMVGLFALSGSVTNWLAVYMLFEKVPFLYGSEVIPNRFEQFKIGIKNLIIQEFFNYQHIEKFFQDKILPKADSINNKIDFDKIFDSICSAIEESPMGSMLSMLGGKQALTPLKEPIINKLKNVITDLINNNSANSENIADLLIDKLEKIIDARLAELTPYKVKQIIQDMIKIHLGWLIVWGGVFGGLIGLVFSFI